MSKSIQRVEISDRLFPLFCPFCGQRVLFDPTEESEAEGPENGVSPCPHTLFVAHDEAFEYRSQRFNVAMGYEPEDNEPFPDLGDESYDSLTDKLPAEYAIKVASYVQAPSFFGTYVGFAVNPED